VIRRLTAEAVGTAFLLAAVVGSGIMAERLSDDVGIQLLANAFATAGVLVALVKLIYPDIGDVADRVVVPRDASEPVS